MLRKAVIVLTATAALGLGIGGVAVAGGGNPSGTGQPNASCESPGAQTPGNSSSAPGSAFNPDGHAGTVYAGEQDQNSKNPHSVSQYDVACTK